MSSGRIIFLITFFLTLLLIDLYVFQAYKASFQDNSTKKKKRRNRIYWTVSLTTFTAAALVTFLNVHHVLRTIVLVLFMLLNFSKLFAVPILLFDDLRRGLFIGVKKIRDLFSTASEIAHRDPQDEIDQEAERETEEIELAPHSLSRSQFLSRAALISASIPFATMSFGIIDGVYDYKVKRVKLRLPNLPKSFEGLKIGQISDIHSGSFYSKKAVNGGIDLLLAEKPDAVFFTGDLVNEQTDEVRDYMDIFSRVKTPLGVYSTLGNHDYGDYKQWASPQAKKQNLDDLKQVHKRMGWDLLMNEHRFIEQGGDKLAIIGIENWGTGRFPKYGRMDLATPGTEDAAVRLLLSHDPSHWRAQVLKDYPQIDAMFAGHTHGMQFGIQFGSFQWSPIQYVYPEWAGFYKEGNQQLYVNVGYGFLGYPGRVGIYPEITIFELTKEV
ncbi:metallophosphoesterase [Solitalea koreensis]|uniref:Calcineurin-like phosphoesterase domain-containing protein n=1 Tax=Solitalea koreensis TaxID=543615 RepID=A0A521AUX2_9SPHI|nr:metallophosphoesterase [Solitalea koreensis]SMO38595.1 hypothetical protein SAMN06265350_101421 [Solitalea koreensis]